MAHYRKLLLACDGSEGSNIAAAHAAILGKMLGAQLNAIWAWSRLPHYPETIDEVYEEEASAQEFFARIRERLESIAIEQGVTVRSEMRAGHPARTIVELAREHDIDLIVLGNQGHSRLWGERLGHTADRVNQYAPCSVLIVRSKEEQARYRKTLIGYDGSVGAEIALRHTLPLAKQLGSEVHVLWIHEAQTRRGGKDDAFEQEWAEQHFNTILHPSLDAAVAEAGVAAQFSYRIGNPARELINEANTGQFRLVALGHRGYSGIWGRLLGGVADRVSNQTRCDVLIVREKE
jgi:nucleotide-binding universal stress UspA family protein